MAELKKLGRYELRRVLGKGAMGVVYEGFDPTLGRLVAIKTILTSAALDEETQRAYAARFSLEAKAVARLNHPNIIQVHDFGVENDAAYLVMEFIRGRDLRGLFDANERFDQAEAVRVMGELLDALDFAHEAGVIHRDVKPANVMLDGQRRVKLADFGVARIQDSDRSAAGTMVGTPAFMSPEQISAGKIDRRTDLFSAGVVLYQLLTGEQPFKGAGAWTVAKKIMQEEPPQPSSLVSNVSPEFDAIVERALAKKPADRYANAREFAAALRAVAAHAPLVAHVPQARPVAPKAAAPAAPRAKAGPRASETELEFWRSIQNSSVAAEFEAYLQQFPEGTYAGLARIKLNTLGVPAAPATSPQAPPQAPAADDATVALPAPAGQAGERKTSLLVPVIVGVLAVAGAAAFFAAKREAAPVAEQTATTAAVPALPAVDEGKIRREVEERIHREYADKTAGEQAAAAKVATEKAIQEKQLAAKTAADKLAAEKAAADKAAVEKAQAEKQLQEKLASAKSAVEKAALEKAAAEKAATEKAAAEKAAAAKAAADKAAVEKAAADAALAEKEKLAAEKAAGAKAAANARAGWPAAGDRWTYDVREMDGLQRKYSMTATVLAVGASQIRESIRSTVGEEVEATYLASPVLTGVAPGVASLWPYLRAFKEIRAGDRWSNLDTGPLWECTSVFVCSASAHVVGLEKVAVRAGSFEAWKIVVDLRMSAALSRGGGEMTFWYSEQAKRFVKYQSRFRYGARSGDANWLQPNVDMELVTYTPAK